MPFSGKQICGVLSAFLSFSEIQEHPGHHCWKCVKPFLNSGVISDSFFEKHHNCDWKYGKGEYHVSRNCWPMTTYSYLSGVCTHAEPYKKTTVSLQRSSRNFCYFFTLFLEWFEICLLLWNLGQNRILQKIPSSISKANTENRFERVKSAIYRTRGKTICKTMCLTVLIVDFASPSSFSVFAFKTTKMEAHVLCVSMFAFFSTTYSMCFSNLLEKTTGHLESTTRGYLFQQYHWRLTIHAVIVQCTGTWFNSESGVPCWGAYVAYR